MKRIPTFLSVVLAVSTLLQADDRSPVRIAAVEIGASSYNGPGPVFRKGHPARFQVTLVNESDRPARGQLAAEVVANLASVHGLPEIAVELPPRSRRAVAIAWDYPGTVVYEGDGGRIHRVPGPRWGLTLTVAWRDASGKDLTRRSLVFGIDRGDDEHGALSAPHSAAGLEADWTLRYSGYLKNPAFEPVDRPADFRLALSRASVRKWRRGTGPDGAETILAELVATTERSDATFEHGTGGTRLVRAWLLDPDARRATRLSHLADLKTHRFTIPPVAGGATLVLVLGPSHHVPPVPLEDLAAAARAKFGEYPDPLRDRSGGPIRTPHEWEGVRSEKLLAIREALGIPEAGSPCDLDPRVISEESVAARSTPVGWSGTQVRRKVSIQVRPGERMNVWLLIPPGLGPFPAVLACHQTVSEGKDEPVGLGGNVWQLDFGLGLVSRGLVVASVDSPTFGERFDALTESAQDTARFAAADPGWSLLARRSLDHARTLDYLQSLPFIVPDRLGAIGHSLGGESVAAITALDPRIRCAVISCPFTLLRTLEHARETYCAPGHAILPRRLGPLLDEPAGKRRLPFDFDDMMQLWAPRPVFYHEVRDELPQFTSAPQTLQAALALRKVYELHESPGRYTAVISAQAHCFPHWVQADALDWLEYWLSAEHAH